MQRSRRPFGLFALVCLAGFALEVAGGDFARAGEGGSLPTTAQAYQKGPLETRGADVMIELPSGAEELLGLSVLAAILYGFRVSGLARTTRVTHAIRSPTFGQELRSGRVARTDRGLRARR